MPAIRATTPARFRANRLGRLIVLVMAIVYLTLAVSGFIRVGWDEFGYAEPAYLFGIFGVGSLLNMAHGFFGLIALIAAWRSAVSAFVPIAIVSFAALSAFGIVSQSFGGGDILNLTWWNVVLYLLTFVVCTFAYGRQMWTVRAPDTENELSR